MMNETIFFFFYNLAHQSVFFDNVVIFFAIYFPFIVALLAGIFLLFYRKSWREFFIVFISSGLAYVCSKILKILIHTERPFVEFSNVQALFSETGFAFPSGHATFFMALAIAIFLLHKKAGYVFIFFALLIGMARIIAGVHFPIDILGGFISGAGISYLFAYLAKSV
jgi:membrane-associated phospholipid phosphatase